MASAAHKLELNPVAPENLLDPVPLYRELRENDPVHWSEAVQCWFITRHEDVVNGFRDPRLSANRVKFYEAQLRGQGPEILPDFLKVLPNQMFMRDGREHIQMRRQVAGGFSPQGLDTWRPAIRRTAEQLVERVQAQGWMDVVEALSNQLPPLVIAEVLGVPLQDREQFMEWAEPLADFNAPAAGTDMLALARRANTAMRELSGYLGNVIEERRRAPGEDLLSKMIQSQEEGQMTPEQLVANAILILVAGHISTTDQLSNSLHDLLTHPDQFKKLQEDRTLVRSAVEEMMRFNTAVPNIHRIATETFQLRGKTIRKGDVVFMCMASANRDPEAFPDPDRFDITRDSNHQKHMSFGFGPHHCLGAGLARRELEIAFEVLLERLPGLKLDTEELPQLKCHSLMFRGFEKLSVRW
ncbi:cytochrome P450 [Vitiosangium sp. GDMCC 1.1324]|uniref:cytochrome P450 n=1 Tax=Vitiosangium sp. (strain GDMCC 1.1324) TaxID=2138576 RepID=UPI000D3B49F4|nr:cytochrome P450 [Vitiosangium sp. GDMCC 1.1324]PTL75787.1 cytochrome P450 [Vitiosangium sp. GDMCC 1.1324]